jgi:hypothetical protein
MVAGMISLRRALATAVVVGVAAFAGGCGGSSKPSYCNSLATLQTSINKLTKSLNLNEGITGLVNQLKKIESEGTVNKIQSEAQTVVSEAKSHYAPQTEAIKSSFDKLSADVKALSSPPTLEELSSLATDGQAAVSSVKALAHATKNACK